MDPEANLRQQQRLATAIINLVDQPEADDEAAKVRQCELAQLGSELAELVLAYLNWRRKGGYA